MGHQIKPPVSPWRSFILAFILPLSKVSAADTTSWETYSLLLNTNFHCHKTSFITATFLRANSVYIPFWSHLWETDKSICRITLAERHRGPHMSYVGLIELSGFVLCTSMRLEVRLFLAWFGSAEASKVKTSTPACQYEAPASNQHLDFKWTSHSIPRFFVSD